MRNITKEFLIRQASYVMDDLHEWQGRKEKCDLQIGGAVGEKQSLQDEILINIGELRALGRLARIDFNLMFNREFSQGDFKTYERIENKINELKDNYRI